MRSFARPSRAWLAVAGMALFAITGFANAGNYAVLQLISTKLTIVRASTTAGSSLDRNQYDVVPLADAAFDEYVLKATTTALERADSSARIRPVRLDPAQARVLQERLDTEPDAVIRQLVTVLQGSKDVASDTSLLLIVPARTEFRLRLLEGHTGQGRAAGMGFYLDRSVNIQSSQTGQTARGFLAPFLNARVLLVAIADGRTIGERTTSSGTVVSFSRSPDDDVWNTLTNEQKMEHLRYLCREDVAGAVFDVVKTATHSSSH